VLHFVLLAIILVVLYFLNGVFFSRDVRAASLVRSIWLPLLFLLVYLALWTGWWIWKLLRAEPEASHFPDIDEAWDLAVRALAHAGMRPGDLPLFLILGRPSGPEEVLFDAAQMNLVVKQAPAGPAPLHVYATHDAIYVT